MDFDQLVAAARSAYQAGKTDEALEKLSAAIKLEPENSLGYFLRASLNEAERNHKQSIADYTKAIGLEKNDAALADAYNRRGSEYLAAGDFKASIADFDAFIKARPDAERSHWKRGIAYFYAGEWEKGQKQFEAYQTFDDADVENAVWRFLCMVPRVGQKQSEEEMLKVGEDRRVPMRQIYELFAGNIKPEDVMKAVNAGQVTPEIKNMRIFYAELYLGLYYDVLGKKEEATKHMKSAVDHKIGHYMWDVAKVHLDVLQAEKE